MKVVLKLKDNLKGPSNPQINIHKSNPFPQ